MLRPGGIILLHECSMIMESGWPERRTEEIAPATAEVRRDMTVFVVQADRWQWATSVFPALSARGIK